MKLRVILPLLLVLAPSPASPSLSAASDAAVGDPYAARAPETFDVKLPAETRRKRLLPTDPNEVDAPKDAGVQPAAAPEHDAVKRADAPEKAAPEHDTPADGGPMHVPFGPSKEWLIGMKKATTPVDPPKWFAYMGTGKKHQFEDEVPLPSDPLSYLKSFVMIAVSEIGDKTFLVAALMAMKYSYPVVFSAAFSALLVMTVLSAFLGRAVPLLISKHYTNVAAAVLFFFFAIRLLREGFAMSGKEGIEDELHEVENEIAATEKEAFRNRASAFGTASLGSLEAGLAGSGGDMAGRDGNDNRSARSTFGVVADYAMIAVGGLRNLFSLLLSPVWVQIFGMTFLGEWGDRSQIATIAMASGPDFWPVMAGALLGHAACTGVAVLGGRVLAGRISAKLITLAGGLAFLGFGFIYLAANFFGSD